MTDRFNAWPAGVKIAAAAVVVTVLRYVLAFIHADGIEWPRWIEAAMLALSGIGQGLVLTGGAVFIAHTVASAPASDGWRIAKKAALVVVLLFLLLSNIILLAPSLIGGLRVASLAQVLSPAINEQFGLTITWDTVWSVFALLSLDALAVGCILAQSLLDAPQPAAVPVAPPLDEHPAPLSAFAIPLAPAADPITISLGCASCGRTFGSQNALNAHKRRCVPLTAPVAVATPNGNGHHPVASP